MGDGKPTFGRSASRDVSLSRETRCPATWQRQRMKEYGSQAQSGIRIGFALLPPEGKQPQVIAAVAQQADAGVPHEWHPRWRSRSRAG